MITRLLRGGIYLGGIDIQSQFVTQRDMVEACVGEVVVNREAEVVRPSGSMLTSPTGSISACAWSASVQ